jgi:hypothetical protein
MRSRLVLRVDLSSALIGKHRFLLICVLAFKDNFVVEEQSDGS